MIKLITITLLLFCLAADAQELVQRRLPLVPVIASSPAPELVWWKMTEDTGTTAADTAGTNTLFLSTSSMWNSGAIRGNGSSYHAEATNVVLGVNIITVSFWASNTAYSGNEMLFESTDNAAGNAYAINCYTDATKVNLAFTGSAASLKVCTIPLPPSGVYNHYLFVFDGSTGLGTITAYTNGVAATVTTTLDTRSGTANLATATWNVLARNAGASIFSDGAIDDFRIYNRDASGDVTAIFADRK